MLESGSEDYVDLQSSVRNEAPIGGMPYDNSVQDAGGVFNVHYGINAAANSRISRTNGISIIHSEEHVSINNNSMNVSSLKAKVKKNEYDGKNDKTIETNLLRVGS